MSTLATTQTNQKRIEEVALKFRQADVQESELNKVSFGFDVPKSHIASDEIHPG